MKRGIFVIFCLVLLGATALRAQSEMPPKREFRAVWLATQKRIDFPSAAGLSPQVLKMEFDDYLDEFQRRGLNAVIVQVRGEGDAWYESNLVPWSKYLSGTYGAPTEPYFDLMAYMVQATHARNMEFHAWFNPFRVKTDASPTPSNHIASLVPSWCLSYGSTLYLDPGIPEVRNYLIAVIQEVVRKYDIDGVHLDDYFYPYPIQGADFPDSLSFRRKGAGYTDINAWRRANIDQLVKDLGLTIKADKPWVKFGISPFGVWRNQQDDPRGSATRAGIRSYDDLHADVRTWHQNGWIDYVAPQIYWSIGFGAADYEVLLGWWKENAFVRHLYVGHALYKIANNSDPNWLKPDEINRQVEMSRRSGIVGGNIFFSSKWLKTNPLGVSDSLSRVLYPYPALPPTMPWIDQEAPAEPEALTASSTREGMLLAWNPVPEANKYLIYRTAANKVLHPSDTREWIATVSGDIPFFRDPNIQWLKRYQYTVTAIDRMKNESTPATIVKKRQWKQLPLPTPNP